MLNKFSIQKSFAISAGAGSGKTYTLSRRYINAILGFDYFKEDYETQLSYYDELKSASVDEIVTITYTEAAALEMKGRIFELIYKILYFDEIDNADADKNSIKEANSHLSSSQKEYVLKTLHLAYQDSPNAKISTIHSYCLDIIKSNADIAKIDTKLNIIKEDEKQKELHKIIFDVFNDTKNKKLVLDISQDITIFFLNNLINRYVSNTKFRNDYDNFSKDSIDSNTYKKLINELYPLPDISDDLAVCSEYIQTHLELKYIDFINKYVENFKSFQAKSWAELSKEYNITIAFNKKPFNKHKDIKGSIDSIKQFEKYVEVYSSIDEEKENLFFTKIEEIKTLLHQIKQKYDERLKELNKIDFDTIILKTLEIIPHVKTKFKYIMVDEFQDTNAVQFDIVRNSCSKDTNLFVVGDSKQSIYSFQGAEIEVFNDAINDKTIFSSVEIMDKNHRSDGVVLDSVNNIFKEQLKVDKNLQLVKPNYEASHQDLFVFKKEREDMGSFKFLITSKQKDDETDELDNIASFISSIYHQENDNYKHISKLISSKQKAIAIIFDSSTKMLELKQKLKEMGITTKVSASDNFYHTKEINDIFHTLKAIDILSKTDSFNDTQKFYLSGAMRSNIIRCDEESIKNYLQNGSVDEKLLHYKDIFKTKTLSSFVKYIYDDSNIMGVYSHFEDIEQRVANLNKFLTLCIEYENSDEINLYRFLSLLENSIYFSEAKEDEAFFKSDNTKSIEICSIHSTKGLAYPLVLLANSEKKLYSQITSDLLKHNNFTMQDTKKEIVGFKVQDYTPLSHRVLKEIDKLKHLAEKKRLLYVALTRAEHDVVISGSLSQNKDGGISLAKDSYLFMICESLKIDKDELFGENENYCIEIEATTNHSFEKEKIEYVEHLLKPINFQIKTQKSATGENESVDSVSAFLGTTTHKIIELYWDSFRDNHSKILDKMMILDDKHRENIIKNMDSFYESDIYTLLKNGVEHRFELEFNVDDKKGFIDLIYYDKQRDGWIIVDFKTGQKTTQKELKYKKQLDFYEGVMGSLGYKIVESRLLWL